MFGTRGVPAARLRRWFCRTALVGYPRCAEPGTRADILGLVRRDEGTVSRARAKGRFDWTPWVLLLLLVASVWFFWVQPMRNGPPAMSIEFEKADG